MSSKFSEQDRQRILDESRELLSRDPCPPRAEAEREDRFNIAGCDPPAADQMSLNGDISETLNQRHAREIGERDARWESERRRERARDNLAVDQKLPAVRAELEELRGHVIAIAKSASTGVERIGDAIAELERKSDSVERIEKLFSRLETRLDQVLPRGVAVDHLPNPLAHRVN